MASTLFGLCILSLLHILTVLSNEINCDQAYECGGRDISCGNSQNCHFQCQANYACSNSTINCPTDHDCYIYCTSSYACSNSIVNCPTNNHQCIIDCASTNSCENIKVNGPTNNILRINCRQTDACFNASFDGRYASLLEIQTCNSDNSCIGMTIYCPEHNDVTTTCSIAASTYFGGTLSSPLTIYTYTGWDDIYFSTTQTVYRNGTIYCGENYTTSCVINEQLSSGSEQWMCKNDENLACVPTPQPTVQPTTTLMPSDLPTFTLQDNPSNAPSDRPTSFPFQAYICDDDEYTSSFTISFEYIYTTNITYSYPQITELLSNITDKFIENEVLKNQDCEMQYYYYSFTFDGDNNVSIDVNMCIDCDSLIALTFNVTVLQTDFIDLFTEETQIIAIVANSSLITSVFIHQNEEENIVTTTFALVTETSDIAKRSKDFWKSDIFWYVLCVMIGIITCALILAVVLYIKCRKLRNNDYDAKTAVELGERIKMRSISGDVIATDQTAHSTNNGNDTDDHDDMYDGGQSDHDQPLSFQTDDGGGHITKGMDDDDVFGENVKISEMNVAPQYDKSKNDGTNSSDDDIYSDPPVQPLSAELITNKADSDDDLYKEPIQPNDVQTPDTPQDLDTPKYPQQNSEYAD